MKGAEVQSGTDAAIAGGQRRRRPSGAPPPLPRQIGVTGTVWLVVALLMAATFTALLRYAPAVVDHIDAALTRPLVEIRGPTLTSIARGIARATAGSPMSYLGAGILIALAVFRRWRHFLVFLISLALVEALSQGTYLAAARPRPFDVTALTSWQGYASPSVAVAAFTALLLGIVFGLVPAGRARWRAKLAVVVLVTVQGLVRVYLGVDHPSDVALGAVLAAGIVVPMFRAFAPNETFPVRYGHRGKSAHLDVTGARGEAIRSAISDQLGLTVLDVKPVGLEGSGGSTPLKLRVQEADGTERSIFAKLYARSHVRADRWYKVMRTIAYGRLEDETAFSTVRRFVEYEDYTLRLLGEYGFPTPTPFGIVEITPEREYLITMEFFEDAVEIGEAEIDVGVIDQGLALIRSMWDVGLAHRDIKPANLMVRDGQLKLIDVFFVQVRPTPWRQAVDLGNMMLVLALRSDAPTVYERAKRFFTEDDLAEAFAATRGVASPTQLSRSLKGDGRNLLGTFRELAPPREPIAIQRWSIRRVFLIIAMLGVAFVSVLGAIGLVAPSGGDVLAPLCGAEKTLVLMAQAVPSAELIPCIQGSLPLGWGAGGGEVRSGEADFWLSFGDTASRTIEVTLTESCPGAGGGIGVEETPIKGGCVTYRSSLEPGAEPVPVFGEREDLAYVAREDLVGSVEADTGLTLCGAGASCEP
jgi:membrane-associated phospholipid phosphatase/tRNA A-37 threonylcarbamoyl transferase component Bud32